MKLFISPHPDDETLFGAFTILREKPQVVIVFDGYVQENRGTGITMMRRRTETVFACAQLGKISPIFLGFRDDDPKVTAAQIHNAIQALDPTEVYAPAWEETGHDQHNLVAEACDGLPTFERYLTYTRANGKSRSGKEVPVLQGEWIAAKLKAMACYESQHRIDPRIGCWPHFLRDLTEYYA